jgi:hypothetical protein
VIDFVASEPHYVDHLLPIWDALPKKARGWFHTSKGDVGGLAVVASWGDLKVQTGPCVYVEHGVGLSYGNRHASYAGGDGRENVVLFLCPNNLSAVRNRKAWPQARVEVVGCPKLDRYLTVAKPSNREPVVAVSFHWDCKVTPETRSALRHYQQVLPALAKEFTVLGAGHPRAWPHLERLWRRLGVEPVSSFSEVVRRADCFVVDNSSTLYEFAALDRPVVALNAPWYRRNVYHGLRFWDHVPGVQVDVRTELVSKVRRALEDPPEWQELRRQAVEVAYPVRGRSAELAATAILQAAAALNDREVAA